MWYTLKIVHVREKVSQTLQFRRAEPELKPFLQWAVGAGVYSTMMFLFQLILGIPEQALSLLHMAIEPILADGAVLDKGRAMFLVAKCQVASAASCEPLKKAEGRKPYKDF